MGKKMENSKIILNDPVNNNSKNIRKFFDPRDF